MFKDSFKVTFTQIKHGSNLSDFMGVTFILHIKLEAADMLTDRSVYVSASVKQCVCSHCFFKITDADFVFVCFQSLLSEFPRSEGRLGLFRRNLRTCRGQRWDANWDQNVLPLITAP